jgi:hypothetical protein
MDQLLVFFEAYWPILAITALLFSVRWSVHRRFSNAEFLSEATLVYGAYLSYYLVRGLVKDQAVVARENTYKLIAFERDLHLFFELQLQEFAIQHELLVNAMNWVYVWLHWPVIAIVLVWLFLNHPREYVTYRNALLISGAIALLFFAFFPVAPPRFVPEFGFIDTIQQRSYSKSVLLPSGLANKYAAVPSLHAGWNLLMAVAIVRHASLWRFKIIGASLPVLMTSSVVLTGNHFIIDAIIGDIVALAGLFLAVYVLTGSRDRDERPTSTPPEYALPTS